MDAEFERALSCVKKQPLNLEVLVAAIEYCLQPREQSEVESYIQSTTADKGALQSPYGLMRQLVASGALSCTELDTQGRAVCAAQKEGLTEDEVDDLVQGWRYEATKAGREVVAYFSPDRRMERLLDAHPTADGAYRSVMRYCETPRSRSDLAAFIERGELLDALQAVLPKGSTLRPSVLMDKLEAAGMLTWDGGWMLTEAGRRYLEEE